MDKIYLKNIFKINQKYYINNILLLLTIINFLNPILSDNFIKINRKLQTKLSIDLKVISGGKVKIIKKDYLPNRIYINGNKSSIDKDGNINTTKYGDYQILNVTIEWDIKKPKYEKVFQEINSVIEIDLSNFDTSGATSMRGMFINCNNLKYVNFTDVDTSLVTTMESMFEGCISLTSLNLSSFVTTKVENMNNMFKNCQSLTSLNLTNFNPQPKK